jgi:hypothetical protein
MKKLRLFLVITMITVVCSGCAVSLPFNNRLSYPAVRDAKNFAAKNKGPISVKWIPPSFPERIDVQVPRGFVGGVLQTRIPTGVGLASRILEALDTLIGVIDSSNKTLTIEIIEAKTEFEYSAGFLIITPAIDVGRCKLEAEFTIGDMHWKEKFFSESKDPTMSGMSRTAVLEKVWDDIAIQVARSVIQHL